MSARHRRSLCLAKTHGLLLVAVASLAGAACARNAVDGRRATEHAAPVAKQEPPGPMPRVLPDDLPLAPEPPAVPGEAPLSRIHIVSASFGATCKQPRDNDTLTMSRRCDGRARCERRLVADPVARAHGDGWTVPCLPEYEVQWTCDGDPAPHVAWSIPSEEDKVHLRFGCGPDAPAALPTNPAPKPDLPAASDDASTVRGRVLSKDGFGWNGTTITIGESSVRADTDGGFVVHGVPKSYDVRIGQTMFLGLTRRDPVLVVGGNYRAHALRYQAAITDAVSTRIVSNEGRGARRVLQFFAPGVATGRRDAGRRGELERVIGWCGDPTVTGLFVSLVDDSPEDEPWASAFLATETLSLTDGDAVAAAPRLRKIGSGRIAGTASLHGPAWPTPTPETLRFSYVVPGSPGSIDLGPCSPSNGKFDCRLPDLSELGGEYCMAIGVGETLTGQRMSRCGGQLGIRDFSEPRAPAPPVMRHGSAVDQDTMVAWTGEGHVFEIMIGTAIHREPEIRILTAKHSLSWSDFLALGMTWDAFERISDNTMETRAGRPAIDVYSVASVHPYQSMDDLVSARHPMVEGGFWQRVSSPRGPDHSEKRIVAIPQTVAARLRAVEKPVEEKPVEEPLGLGGR